MLDKGVVQQVGAPMKLYDDPVNAVRRGLRRHDEHAARAGGEARRRESSRSRIEGVGEVDVPSSGDDGPAASAAPARMSAAFRPHSFRVEPPGATRDSRCAWMQGTVEESEFLGESTRYRVRVGPHSLAVDQSHTAGMSKFPVGASVSLGLDPTQVRLFAD